jgi:hypothetical protein
VLAHAMNLQSALTISFELSRGNRPVQGIALMPNERIFIAPNQIARLWKHFNFQPERV